MTFIITLWLRNRSSKLGRIYCGVPLSIQWLPAGWNLELRIHNKKWNGFVLMSLLLWRRRRNCAIFGRRNRSFSPPEYPNSLWDPQDPIQRVHSHLTGVNRPGPEAGLFFPYKAEFKNTWSSNSTPSIYPSRGAQEIYFRGTGIFTLVRSVSKKSNWRMRMILYVHPLQT